MFMIGLFLMSSLNAGASSYLLPVNEMQGDDTFIPVSEADKQWSVSDMPQETILNNDENYIDTLEDIFAPSNIS